MRLLKVFGCRTRTNAICSFGSESFEHKSWHFTSFFNASHHQCCSSRILLILFTVLNFSKSSEGLNYSYSRIFCLQWGIRLLQARIFYPNRNLWHLPVKRINPIPHANPTLLMCRWRN